MVMQTTIGCIFHYFIYSNRRSTTRRIAIHSYLQILGNYWTAFGHTLVPLSQLLATYGSMGDLLYLIVSLII